jgi:signal peptidase II
MAQPTAGPKADSRRATARLLGTALTVLVTDQVVKKLVVRLMALGASVDVIGSTVRLTRTQNTGAAFGLLRGRGIIFIVISSLASAAIVVFRREIAKLARLEQFAFALVLGGALGNLVDRVRPGGAVVDFIDVGIRDLRWPAFNVADSSIVVGVTLLAVRFLFFARPGAPEAPPSSRNGKTE